MIAYLVSLTSHLIPFLQLKDVFGYYEEKYILEHITLVLKPGRTYLVMGPPGCGKTSLLKAIAGRLKNNRRRKNMHKHYNASFSDGRIEYNGVSIEVRTGKIIGYLSNIISLTF